MQSKMATPRQFRIERLAKEIAPLKCGPRGNVPGPSPLMENTRGGVFMPRFFFHVADGSTLKDEDGENLPSIASARAHAARIASELAEAGDYGGYAVRVRDEQGNEVAYVPIGKRGN
jgi:hypothetical protein